MEFLEACVQSCTSQHHLPLRGLSERHTDIFRVKAIASRIMSALIVYKKPKMRAHEAANNLADLAR